MMVATNASAAQLAQLLHVCCADCHDTVTVQHLAALVNNQAAVSVAVKCDTNIVVARAHALLQVFQMSGTAVCVDVDAIRLVEAQICTGIPADASDESRSLKTHRLRSQPQHAGRSDLPERSLPDDRCTPQPDRSTSACTRPRCSWLALGTLSKLSISSSIRFSSSSDSL